MHAAHACAEAIGRSVALIDIDLNCGVQGFLAKTEEGVSVLDAAQYAERMDDALWDRIVATNGKVDLLRSGGNLNPGMRVESPQLHRLLGYAERRYPITFIDHSGNWERYSVDTMERSSRIFQVCTTDLTSLHFARRNMDAFHEMGVRDRVQVILNRATYHSGLNARTVESILGSKPLICLPNAFATLQAATKEAKPVSADSAFGQEIQKLKREILKNSRLERLVTGEAKPLWKLDAIKSAISALRTRNSGPGSETHQIQ